MSQVKLKRLLTRKHGTASPAGILQANPDVIGVADAEGSTLFGTIDDTSGRYPIVLEDETLGWVIGEGTAELAARLLSHLVRQEAENAALTDDTLDLYREINLLYSLSERLSSSLDVHVVGNTVLEEANRLIHSTDGFVLLASEFVTGLIPIAKFAQPDLDPLTIRFDDEIWRRITSEEKAEIINDMRSGTRFAGSELLFEAIAYAPLKGRQRTIGMILLIRRMPIAYTARDIKLLNALASQAAPALENALFHKKALEEAREREERLQKQIRELRIELDEARQEKQVAEITESEFFQQLSAQADDLRRLMSE